MNVEQDLQRLPFYEMVKHRPDTFIGSTTPEDIVTYVVVNEPGPAVAMKPVKPDTSSNKPDTSTSTPEPTRSKEFEPIFEKTKITIIPGFCKIIDELLVNAADHRQRNPHMTDFKVDLDRKTNELRVYNTYDGKALSIEMLADTSIYKPQAAFTMEHTSQNYNDDEKRTTGGRNGYGSKLAVILSKRFTIQIYDTRTQQMYTQVVEDNCTRIHPPVIKPWIKGKQGYVQLTARFDFEYFKLDGWNQDHVRWLYTRVVQLGGSMSFGMGKHGIPSSPAKKASILSPSINVPESPNKPSIPTSSKIKPVKVRLNGYSLDTKSFKTFVDMYHNPHVIHDTPQERWHVSVGSSSTKSSKKSFEHVSFVNNIATLQGGKHVDDVSKQIVDMIAEHLEKKHKDVAAYLTRALIKDRLCIWINCLIENPTFDTQTKVNMTLPKSKWGSSYTPSKAFTDKLLKSDLLQTILDSVHDKAKKQLSKQDGKKTKRVNVEKLEDAQYAGTVKSGDCFLILTEGDSAKALAMAGLSVVGREYYGVYPLRGKFINVDGKSLQQQEKNEELRDLKTILGLKSGMDYVDTTSLRYGHVIFMTDQDHDGSHIKGLLINLFRHSWPSLLNIHNFMYEFITPIVKATRGSQVVAFYTIPEYEQWKQSCPNLSSWSIKHYKGLGTSTSQEAKEYFSNLDFHCIPFSFHTDKDKEAIKLAFDTSDSKPRKKMLAEFKYGTYLDHHMNDTVDGHSFIHKDWILYAIASNERSIPSAIDGLKPSQRKALWCAFKKQKQIKVASLAGMMIDSADYHHGEKSASDTIIGMAQTFPGANNVELLKPAGQFGTRALGGADSASARYIFTELSDLARNVIFEEDNAVLPYVVQDGGEIEPRWYAPILPGALMNPTSGIGTGYSTNIPGYHPHQLSQCIRQLLVDSSRPLPDLVPWYRKYSGEIRRVSANHFKSFGHAKIVNPYVVEIDELPIGTWIANYKSQLETWVTEEKIVEFKENHIDDFVSFRVVFQSTQSTEWLTNQPDTFYETMKLVQSVKPHLVAFRHDGSLHHYQSPEEIIREFFTIRHDMYVKRRSLLIHQAKRKLSRASNQRRFIDEVNEDVLHVRNVSKSVILEQLIARKYDPFDTESNGDNGDHAAPVGSDDSQHDSSESNMNQYRYLLNMPLWSLTKERAASLAEQVKSLEQQLQVITDTTVTMMWTQELDAFDKAYQVHLDTQCQRPLPGQKRTQSSLVQSTLKRSRVGSNDSRESKVKKQKTLNLIPTSVQQAW